jgi:chromosome partitioning protein
VVISFANQKGGVAKTTTAINVAAGLVLEGCKVLLIDSDPQANATSVFLNPPEELDLEETLYNAIKNLAPLAPLTRKTALPNLDFVPSHLLLSGIELELAQAYDNRGARLRQAVEEVKQQYDYILFDSPPNLGLLTVNSFAASDYVIIPASTAFFALSGLVQLQETINNGENHATQPTITDHGRAAHHDGQHRDDP